MRTFWGVWVVCVQGWRLSLNRRAELGVWLPTQRGLAALGWPGSLRWEPTAGETHHCRRQSATVMGRCDQGRVGSCFHVCVVCASSR